MAEPGTIPAADAAVAGTPPPESTGGLMGGTPSPKAADAAGTEQDAGYWKAEAQKAFVARDAAKKNFLEGDEGKQIIAARDEALRKLADLEVAKKAADDAEALKRGEFQKLYEAEKTQREGLEVKMTEAARAHRVDQARSALAMAYTAAGGHDAELFQLLTEKYITDGSVAVESDGHVKGVVELIQKVRGAKPSLFGAGGGSPAVGAPAPSPMDLMKPSTRGGASLMSGEIATREQLKAAIAASRGS